MSIKKVKSTGKINKHVIKYRKHMLDTDRYFPHSDICLYIVSWVAFLETPNELYKVLLFLYIESTSVLFKVVITASVCTN